MDGLSFSRISGHRRAREGRRRSRSLGRSGRTGRARTALSALFPRTKDRRRNRALRRIRTIFPDSPRVSGQGKKNDSLYEGCPIQLPYTPVAPRLIARPLLEGDTQSFDDAPAKDRLLDHAVRLGVRDLRPAVRQGRPSSVALFRTLDEDPVGFLIEGRNCVVDA
jgi:hypothetical protein